MGAPLTIGQAVAKLRSASDSYSWYDLAEMTGLSAATLRRALELNASGEPQMHMRTFVAMAEGMGFDLRVVLDEA